MPAAHAVRDDYSRARLFMRFGTPPPHATFGACQQGRHLPWTLP